MTAALMFTELLERAGAWPGRGRRWWCPKCQGKTPALAVDPERELFYCHRCQWRGGRLALERELGIEAQKPTPAVRHRANLIRMEAERFADWVRRRRIETAALLRTLDKADADWLEAGRQERETGGRVSERTWRRLHMAWLWAELTEQTWKRLCEFERNAPELYGEFVSRGQAA